MNGFRKILCAIDFSEGSRLAMRGALDLAGAVDADEVTLVHVSALPGVALPEGYVIGGPEAVRDMLDAVDRELARWRKDAEAQLLTQFPTGHRPIVGIKSLLGYAADEIARCAGEERYDLVVCGSHGRTGIAHALLGSIAEKLVRLAPCPVLCIRAPKHPNRASQPHAA